MKAILKIGLLKNAQDKGLYFWTLVLPLIFTVLFISIFTSGAITEDKADITNSIVPGYAVMFVFFIMISMCHSFAEDRDKGMVARLASTSLSSYSYLGGKWGTYFFIVNLQIGILMLFGKVVYHIPFEQPLYLLALALMLSLSVTSMGVLLALLVQSPNTGIAVTQIVALGGAVLGGLWMPLDTLPTFIQHIAKVTPQYWAHQAFQQAMTGHLDVILFLKASFILLGIAVLCFVLSLWRYPRFLQKAKH